MKRLISLLLSVILMFSFFVFDTYALEEDFDPYVISFSLTSDNTVLSDNANDTRATGLITSYSLSISKTGTTLKIYATTYGSISVVKSGFKDIMVQRRKTSSDSWYDYYDYGNVYVDEINANLSTSVAVVSGYQYRVTCTHYAKKNLLMIQTVDNVSNIITI